jgi:lichenan operon transcriptional antiterminator
MENRQTQILIYLFENKDQYVTGSFLADLVHASLRTVKNEIRELSEKASDFGAMVESIPSKGYHLTILDSTRFQQKITTLSENYNTLLNMNDPLFRVHFMLAKMLQSTDFIPASRFMEEMYVSRSTVSNDLIHLKALLSAYDLSLESRPNRGLRIVGKEKDKRRCIINENVPNSLVNNTTDDNLVDQITDSILSILIDAHYKVSDIIFQNLVLHIELSVKRRSQGFVIENVTVPKTPEFLHVRQIAEKNTRKMCEEYNLEYSEQEANYLAIALQGKRELDNPSYINKEINDFVFDSLKEIKNTYHIDLLQDTRLRIALALHTLPLLTRAREHSQINNVLKLSIKQNFPFAYDLATSFAYQLQKRYHVHLIDDEISYLAVHFSVSLENTPDKTEKKILLISAQKPSDTILIQQKIYQWFQNQISLFDTISLMKLDSIEFEKYDTIFTTEPDLASRYRTMVLIPYFLTNLDYPKIELAINGFSSADSCNVVRHMLQS